MILAGRALVSVCNVRECVGIAWLLQCGAGITALVFRFSLKLQKSQFKSVGNSREWERGFREGEEM